MFHECHQSSAQRLRAFAAAKAFRSRPQGMCMLLPQGQATRIRIHESVLIQYGIFVRIISRAGAKEGGHKCALTAHAAAGQHEHPIVPGYDASMNENAPSGKFADMDLYLSFQNLETQIELV